jgi:lipopolysaccharide transport system ATP-binding protein
LAANTIWALKDVSFEVPRGEVLGIIGRNGAGKSTLLRILSRITKPTSGTALITGRVGSLLEVGTGFHPELTGRENIYLNGAILGMKRQEIIRKFDEIVAFSEIERFLDTPVKRYSSGMYVRLAFAVAAHLEPEILIVDEVLAVGDVAFQTKCLGKMGNVAREGRTVLFVSHSMPAVCRLCQQALLIDEGRLIMHGSADTVVERYLLQDRATDEAVFKLPASSAVAPGSPSTLRLLGSDGEIRARFRIGEKWQIALDFDIRRFTQHVIAAVGILTRESVPIITYYSEPADLQPGTYTVEFDCDLSLAKAELRFAIGLSSFERAFYFCDAVGRAVVEDVAIDSQPFRASGSGLLISRTRPNIRPTYVPT